MTRLLVAGIGNIFLGDDGFGVEAVRRLAACDLPPDVEVRDFGIRGMDLAFALMNAYDAAILVDAAQRGEPPGTLTLLEPRLEAGEVALDTHGWEPLKVLALAQGMGATLPPVYVVACEPGVLVSGPGEASRLVDLSGPVEAAVDGAVGMVLDLLKQLGAEEVTNHA
ncbi:MAG: hydrogenase maturation protease [Chloroflexota bacterium]